MLPGVLDRLHELPDDTVVLDVGGWAAPIHRADWVLDAMPYQTRGALGFSFGDGGERFGPATWIECDICDREPWPFADDFFDFSICVTTLEDVRDPIWVCSELGRVSKAGYVEVPAIELELCRHVDESQGPWLGHSHHRWFCELDAERSELVFWHKSHAIHSDRRLGLTHAQIDPLGVEELL